MKTSTVLKLLAFSLTTTSAGLTAAAAEERPRLHDYPSSYAFLQALEVWNREHPGGAISGTPASPASEPKSTVAVDPTSELAPPPFEVTGPENLDTAVEKARDIAHPDYKEKTRYRRSTHLSFPLHSIDGQDMSQASVGDALDIKGTSETEKIAGLQKLASQLEEDPLKQQDLQKTGDTSRFSVPALPGDGAPLSGPRVKVDISVSSH